MFSWFGDGARLERLQSAGLLVLRAGAGAMMLFAHGWPKLRDFSHKSATFTDPLGIGSGPSLFLATFAEVVCAALLIPGLFTRLAAIPLILTMMVAAFLRHAGDSFAQKEKALLFLVIFLAVGLAGPGRYSVDHVFRKSR